MMMLKSDLYDLLSRALDGRLDDNIQFSGVACCIVLASKGYPEYYKKYLHIRGLEDAEKIENVKIFHAGTEKEGNGIYSNGGRVFGVTGYSQNNIEDARNRAYGAISKIKIPGGFSYRKDIAQTTICDNCHGKGWHDYDGDKLDDEGSEKCVKCNGTGRIFRDNKIEK